MRYSAKDAVQPWPAGDYNAEILSVEAATSRAGNAMEVITFALFSPGGKRRAIKDYIVNPSTIYKLKQLAIALGRKAEFEAETFQASDYIGSGVVAEVVISPGKDGFDDQNAIKKVKAPAADAAPRPIARELREKTANADHSTPFGDEPQMDPADIPF
jgi:hypothetical protein